MLPDSIALVATEFEISNRSTFIMRAGLEVPLIPEFTLRAGIDRSTSRRAATASGHQPDSLPASTLGG
jgi:hypothetical protein